MSSCFLTSVDFNKYIIIRNDKWIQRIAFENGRRDPVNAVTTVTILSVHYRLLYIAIYKGLITSKEVSMYSFNGISSLPSLPVCFDFVLGFPA